MDDNSLVRVPAHLLIIATQRRLDELDEELRRMHEAFIANALKPSLLNKLRALIGRPMTRERAEHLWAKDGSGVLGLTPKDEAEIILDGSRTSAIRLMQAAKLAAKGAGFVDVSLKHGRILGYVAEAQNSRGD